MLLKIVAFLAFVSLGLPDGVLGVAWPSVRRTFGLPLSTLGVLLAAAMLGYLTSSFASGALVARIGVGRVLAWSSAVTAGAAATSALAPAWPAMVVAGVLGGLGAGAIDAGINAHGAVAFSPRVLIWLHACYGVGATVGPLLMTAAVMGPLGWRGGYGAIALVLAAMTACFAATAHLWSRPAAPAAPAAVERAAEMGGVEPGTGQPGSDSSGLFGTLRRPATWAGIALFFLYTGLEVSAGQWAYSLLTEARGMTEAMAGAWVSAYWGSLTVGRIAVGGLATRLPAVALLRLGMLAAPVAATLLWLAHGPLGGLLALALLGLAFAGIFPLLIAETPARLGIAATRHAVGFQVAGACLGVAMLPGAVGVLAAHAGLEVTGPAIAVGALALLGLHEAVLRTTRTPTRLPGPAQRKI